MNPVTHWLSGWSVAAASGLDKRERIVFTVAGLIPDIDGLGIVPEFLTAHTSHPLLWYSDYHHIYGHNIVFGVVLTIATYFITKRRWKTAALAFVSFHVHLFCDLLGSGGPHGFKWGIAYFYPFSNKEFLWQGQWAIVSWQNLTITTAALIYVFYSAARFSRSPLEIFSKKADGAFITAVQRRFKRKHELANGEDKKV